LARIKSPLAEGDINHKVVSEAVIRGAIDALRRRGGAEDVVQAGALERMAHEALVTAKRVMAHEALVTAKRVGFTVG
jgi:hypothetical protein